MTRPLVSLALGATVVAVAVVRAPTLSGIARRLAIAAAAALPGVACFLAYNNALNGGPFTLGYAIASPEYHHFGFYTSPLYPFTPFAAVLKTAHLLRGLNEHFLAWPLPSLWLAAVLLAVGPVTGRAWALLALGACGPLAYFAYWFQDMCYGPRFAYESIPFWAILSAHAVVALAGPASARPVLRNAIPLLLAVSILFGLGVRWPALMRDYATAYWGIDRRVVNAVERAGLTNAVVIINDTTCHPWSYGAGFWANDPGLDGPVVYARHYGDEGARALRLLYPERTIYRFECPADELVPVP